MRAFAAFDASQVPDVLTQGFVAGTWYAGVALGIALLFRSTGIFNFAAGALFLLGPYLFIALVPHMPWVAALVCSLMAIGAITGSIDRILMPRMATRNHLSVAILTFGIAVMIEAIVAYVWKYTPREVPSPVGSAGAVDLPLGASVTASDVLGTAMILATFVVVIMVWDNTRLGLRMRACAENPLLAGMAGVSYRSAALTAWIVAGVVTALAGIVFAMEGSSLNPAIANVGLLAFPALVLGGLDSLVGSLVGGVILGLTQAAIITWWDPTAQYAVSYAILLVVVLIRPRGLFGSPEIARV